MFRLFLILALASVLLVGCGTTELTDAQVEAMSQPTVKLECESGCIATYTDPRDRMEMPTNGYDVANNAIGATANILTSVAPWAAIAVTATDGIAGAVGDVDSSDNSVDSSDNSVSDSSDNSTDSSDNSVDSSDNSVDSSDNSIDRSDNSVDSSDNSDNTADPTIVTP